MATQKFLGLPTIPHDLKPMTAYLQRAEELKAQDPVISYWCAYYAAQLGIELKTKDPGAREFLFALLSTLERLKKDIGANDAIHNEMVSAAYVENFALRVFVNADNEDRKGSATRATAKKFIAAANFLEVLKTFPKSELSDSHDERIRYAKWKAIDIAKAFREGRKPTPGPAGSDIQAEVPDAADSTTLPLPRGASPSRLSPLNSAGFSHPSNDHEDVDNWSTAATVGIAEPGRVTQSDLTHANHEDHDHRRSIDGQPTLEHKPRTAWVSEELENPVPPLPPRQSPSPPYVDARKSVHFSPSVVGGTTNTSSGALDDMSSTTSPVPPSPTYATTGGSPTVEQNLGLTHGRSRVLPHLYAGKSTPPPLSYPPPMPCTPLDIGVLPPAMWHPPTNQPQVFDTINNDQFYAPVPATITHLPHSAIPHVVPPPPPPEPSSPPHELELSIKLIAEIQKKCRYVISALDYEDAQTARKELRAALALLGG